MGNHTKSAVRRAPDASAQDVMDHLRRIVQVLRVSGRDAEKRAGVSMAQLFVLSKLAEARGGALSVNELAERTLTHQSSVSVVVSRLVDGGYVERMEGSGDRRRVELSLTAKGRALVRKGPVTAQDQIIAGLKRMTAARRKKLAQLLRELAAKVGVEKTKPPMFLETNRDGKG